MTLFMYTAYIIFIYRAAIRVGGRSRTFAAFVCVKNIFTKFRHFAHHHLQRTGSPAHLLLFGNNFAWQKLSSFVFRVTCLGVTHVRCYSTGERFINHSTGFPSNIKEFGRGVTRAPLFRNRVQKPVGSV